MFNLQLLIVTTSYVPTSFDCKMSS